MPSASQALRAVHRVEPGHVIANRYDVLSILGEGGMGVVYRCADRHTQRQVAVKQVITPGGSAAADYLAWFAKEARAQALLTHPGIVQARDFGQLADGSPYLAMDLVQGSSLHELGQAQLSYPVIWAIVDQMLDALAHAHARRVIHGDLKPSNVIVQARPKRPPLVRILDFGLAWLKEDPHDERLDGEKALIFIPHAGAGTPGYMAPEQIKHESHHVCGATDLYAVGCLLFRLLSSRPPFTGDNKQLLQLHAYEPTPPLRLAIEAPTGVVEYTMRLLQKQPWDRFEFAAEARRTWRTFAPSWPIEDKAWQLPLPQPPTEEDPPTRPPQATKARDFPQAGKASGGLLGIRPPPLVGREQIRSRLLNVAKEVTSGQGAPHRLVLLLGPAGVGKSRLAEWLCTAIHEEGRMVPLTVRYRKLRSSSNGMMGAVNQYFNFERADRLTIERSLMDRWRPGPDDTNLRAWVAGAAEWLRPTPPHARYEVGPTGIRFRVESPSVRRQVTRFTLRKIANGRPLLFFLDDLHNAPDTVVDGILKIHESEKDQRIFMVATVRTEDVQLGSPIANELRRLRNELSGEVLQVLPMNRHDTCELVRASLPLDDQAVMEAARRSRGFPLFALQQLHAWAQAGDLNYCDGRYTVSSDVLRVRPQTTAELWDARLSSLSPHEQLAACAVASLGIDMRVVVIEALLDALQLPVHATLSALRGAEIILPRGRSRYTWPHALLQEHLLVRLSHSPDADRIFEAAARALEHHPLVGTRRVVRQRVINLLNAHKPDQASHIFFDFLSQTFSGALQPRTTLSDLELLNGRLSGVHAARLLRWRAEMLRTVGDPQIAKQLTHQARAALIELGENHDVAHCTRLLGQLESGLGNLAAGLELVDEALTSFENFGDPLGMAQCEAAMAEILYQQGTYEKARLAARSAADHFQVADRPMGRDQCLLLLCWIAHSEGRAARARRLALEAQESVERSGYRPGLAEATLLRAHVEHRLSNFYTARQLGQEALEMFEGLGMPHDLAKAERLLAMVAIDTTELDDASAHAKRAAQLYEDLPEPAGQSSALILLSQIALCRFDTADAARLLTQAQELGGNEPGPRQERLLTEAWLRHEQGNFRDARQALENARTCFGAPNLCAEHTRQVLSRLSCLRWPDEGPLGLIVEWQRAIDNRELRDRP